jgi:hypothetical protein
METFLLKKKGMALQPATWRVKPEAWVVSFVKKLQNPLMDTSQSRKTGQKPME